MIVKEKYGCTASDCRVEREMLGKPMGARFTVSGERDKRKRHEAKRASWIQRNERSAQGSFASNLPHRGARVKRRTLRRLKIAKQKDKNVCNS